MYNTAPVYLLCIFIFLVFLKFSKNDYKSKYIRNIINFFSSSVFSVYLIHDNIYLRAILWKMIIISRFNTSIFISLIVIVFSLFIFIICTIIDKITWFQVKKYVDKLRLKFIQEKFIKYLYT